MSALTLKSWLGIRFPDNWSVTRYYWHLKQNFNLLIRLQKLYNIGWFFWKYSVWRHFFVFNLCKSNSTSFLQLFSLQSCCIVSAVLRQCHTKYAKDPHYLSSNDASLEVRNVHVSMSNGILSNLLLKHNLMTLTPDNYLIGQICLLFAKFNDFFWFHVLLCGFYIEV